jgi:hypothetical protein
MRCSGNHFDIQLWWYIVLNLSQEIQMLPMPITPWGNAV